MKATHLILHEHEWYRITDEEPKNGDLVITEKYGVWEFQDLGGASAPMPYWPNKNACKKIEKVVKRKHKIKE